MASLMELVERVNKGELIDSEQLEMYQESPNSAEKFLRIMLTRCSTFAGRSSTCSKASRRSTTAIRKC